MDSLKKSVLLGRLAGPVFWIIAAGLHFFFDISVDEQDAEVITKELTAVITYLCALWGTLAPIWSKYRQARQSR